MNLAKYTLFLFVLFAPFFGHAQIDDSGPRRGSKIIDDTTKQIYGPKSSRYYYEDDVFMNREIYHRVDTVIRNFHRFNDVQRNNNLYQDLGVIGTPIRPIYYEVPDVIGVTPGFSSLDAYWDRESIRNWDTKSPYSNMTIILGGRGRSVTRASFNRNIGPRVNFGFNYRGLFIDKQYSREAKGDRNVRSQYYDLFTSYQSKDSTYRLFVNFRRNKHEVSEMGGVRDDVPPGFQYKDFFSITAEPWLVDAANTELRTNIHVFHQYKVGKALQVYHKLDRYKQGNRFTDNPASEPDYDFVAIDSAETNDKTKFKTFRNEFGIKGSVSKLFYSGYYAIRDYTMNYTYDTLLADNESNILQEGQENYVGGRIALKLDSLVDVIGRGELLVDKDKSAYFVQGTIRSKWFDATLKQAQYVPSFLQQYYLASHDFWKIKFDEVNTTQLSGALHYRSKVFSVSPGATATRIGNYIYFKRDSVPRVDLEGESLYPESNVKNTDVIPLQDASENLILSPKIDLEVTLWKHVKLSGNVIYTVPQHTNDSVRAESPFQIPDWFVNAQLSYENIHFNGNLDMHAGVDFHWKSEYYAPAYDVPTMQYYVQGNKYAGFNAQGGDGMFQTPALPDQMNLPVVDLFLNAKIKRARIFLKYNNILQAFFGQGYFPTPLYPGQRNSLDFGFDWSFYD